MIIGRSTKENDFGLNASLQKKKVADFGKGNIQILCVTTVAEEGLDISECRLVIEYNNVGSEIGHLQRKGNLFSLASCKLFRPRKGKKCQIYFIDVKYTR